MSSTGGGEDANAAHADETGRPSQGRPSGGADEDPGRLVQSDDDAAATEFAPAEPTDGRKRGDWQTRYTEKTARRRIRWEAGYVSASLIGYPILMLAVALQFGREALGISEEDWNILSPFVLAYLGGALGGTLFSTKWLYHAVARGTWNVDRWLWRVFTPMLSAGAAEAIVLLSAGRIIPIFGADLVRTNAGALGVAILVGYFSDKTFSRLEGLADQHLGPGKGAKASKDDSPPDHE